MTQKDFDGLAVPKMHLNIKPDARAYRVYSSPNEFVVVDAEAAHEAIEKSGIENPIRIINITQVHGFVIDDELLESSEEDAILPVTDQDIVPTKNFTSHRHSTSMQAENSSSEKENAAVKEIGIPSSAENITNHNDDQTQT